MSIKNIIIVLSAQHAPLGICAYSPHDIGIFKQAVIRLREQAFEHADLAGSSGTGYDNRGADTGIWTYGQEIITSILQSTDPRH